MVGRTTITIPIQPPTQYRHPKTLTDWFLSNVLLSVDIWPTVKHALSAEGEEEQVALSPLSAVSVLAPVMEINEVSGE